MNREDIIRIAHESHLDVYGLGKDYAKFADALERFAALVAYAEREACADMVYRYISQTVNMEARGCLASVAYDIRARGQA